MINWNYDCKRVLWSDETKIEYFGFTLHQNIGWQKQNVDKEKDLMPTAKYGGGALIFWRCFVASGPGALFHINGTIH